MGVRRKGEGKRREGEGTEWEERKSRGKDEIIKRENRQREVGRKRGEGPDTVYSCSILITCITYISIPIIQ